MTRFQFSDPLDADALAALRESIAAVGVLNPVILSQDGDVLDGHHRVAICDELGIGYPTHVVEIDGDEDGWVVATTLNAVRRHMDLGARRSAVADLRARGFSLRSIARAMGVSKAQVQKDLAKVDTGCPPATVHGADGKTYPATQPAHVTHTTTTKVEHDVDPETAEIVDKPAPVSSSPGATTGGDASGSTTAASSPVEPIADDEAPCKHRYLPWEFNDEDDACADGHDWDVTDNTEPGDVEATCRRCPAYLTVQEPAAAPTSPAPAPSPAPRRKPLPEQITSAAWDLRGVAERLQKLADDDRFRSHINEVGPALRSHLTATVEVCQDLLDRCPPTKEIQ